MSVIVFETDNTAEPFVAEAVRVIEPVPPDNGRHESLIVFPFSVFVSLRFAEFVTSSLPEFARAWGKSG